MKENLGIKKINESRILEGIIRQEKISRSDLAKLTGLTKASISTITKRLIQDGLIIETGSGEASVQGGPKPIFLEFNPKSALALSFDLNVNGIKGTLAYLNGEAIATIPKKNCPISADTIVGLIETYAKELCANKPEGIPIIGMTIAIGGIVYQNKIIFTPYNDLNQIDLYEQLSHQYDFPIFIENGANLAALGEYVYAVKTQTLVNISIHNGIGAGIIINGHINEGEHGEAGEIGHSILYPKGKKCPCGNEGCLEQYASNTILYQIIAKQKNLDTVNASVVKKLYDENDPETISELENNAFLLGIAINNIMTVYDPEIILINSSIYRLMPSLLELVTKNLNSKFSENVQIKNGQLGEQAILLGGVALCCQKYLGIKDLKF